MVRNLEEYKDLFWHYAAEERSSLREIAAILFRHKWKILAFFITTFVLVTAYTYITAEIYQSDARLLIKVGRESVAVDPSVEGPTIALSQSRENEVNSEVAILKSRFLAEKVVDKIGPAAILDKPDEAHSADPLQENLRDVRRSVRKTEDVKENILQSLDISGPLGPREKAIIKVMENLDVELEKKSHIINLSFKSQNPAVAQQVLASLMDFYLEHHIQVHGTQASPRFFEEQTNKLMASIKNKEDELKNIQTKYGIASVDEQKTKQIELVSTLKREKDEVAGLISSSQGKIQSLEEALKGKKPTVVVSRIRGRTNFAADAMAERLNELRLKEADLSARYPDNYRGLVDLRQQIKAAQKSLAREQRTRTETTTGLDANYQSLQLALDTEKAELMALKGRQAALKKELAQREKELADLAKKEIDINRLQRELTILEDEYVKYRDNLGRANVSKALDIDRISNVSIVQPATRPLKPIKPKKLLNIALGFLLGIFGGLALAFILEYLDNRIKTVEDVEKWLELPVLATISYEEFKGCT